jgi:hydrogenase maturation protease
MASYDPFANDCAGLDQVAFGCGWLKRGDRVRIRPKGRADVWDQALAGRSAVVEALEQDAEEQVYVAVVLEDDPGKDLGWTRQTGHRFFYRLEEVEPIDQTDLSLPKGSDAAQGASTGQVLVAGVGNIFLGDDAFGVEVVRELARRPLPAATRVVDFGIRGFDLACALTENYAAVILVDATARGGKPGTTYLLELAPKKVAGTEANALNSHSLTPESALALARALGGIRTRVFVAGCEPAVLEEDQTQLSEPARGAVPVAIQMIEDLVMKLLKERPKPGECL